MSRDPNVPDVFRCLHGRGPAQANRCAGYDGRRTGRTPVASPRLPRRVLVVNGPFREQSDPSYRGMSIFACDAAEAARLSEGDPSVAAVRLRSASAGRCPMTDRPPQRRTPSTCGLRRLAGRPVNGSVGPAVQDEFVAGRGLVVNPINSGHPHCHGGESLRADDT